MKLTPVIAERVADRMRRYGYTSCTAGDVFAVERWGVLPDHEALGRAILEEFEELGALVPVQATSE